jgi:hypothetical protein
MHSGVLSGVTQRVVFAPPGNGFDLCFDMPVDTVQQCADVSI